MAIGAQLSQLLKRYAVDCVFGIPGVHTLELYRGLAGSGIRHVTPRHEQAAGFMADGYARTTGKPGVCFIISGPGVTNILTAMGQAYADSIPMLVISSVNAQGRMGSGDGWLHELPDQQSLLSGVSAFSHTIHRAEELPQVLARAYAVFNSSRPRPVHIEIPVNILAAQNGVPISQPVSVCHTYRPSGNPEQLAQAANLINAATCPLILAGGGAVQAASALHTLAENLNAPLVMTVNARGILPSTHPLAVAASASLQCVRGLINAADVIIAIGTELGSTDYDFNEDGEFNIAGTLVRIDIDPQQLVRNRIPELAIVGDSHQTVSQLLPLLNICDHNRGEKRANHCRAEVGKELSGRYGQYIEVLNTVRDTLENAIIAGDSTQLIYAGNCGFAANQPGAYFNSATGFGTLGYGLAAAIGAAIAKPACPVVGIVGDGGLQFSIAELATATDAATKLTLIVHQNGGYAEIKQFMQANDAVPMGVDIYIPNLIDLATACGWATQSLDSLEELEPALLKASAASVATMIIINDELFENQAQGYNEL